MKRIAAGIILFMLLLSQQGYPQHYEALFSGEALWSENPLITEVVSSISVDSIRSFMEELQGMGTRFMYAENRRQVAERIAGKFRSFGYDQVELDSFRIAVVGFRTDSVWQYNVVAESTGTSAPQEIYVLSAHHDDFCMPDPYSALVPGADDNASGCAVALEIARVFKSKGFQHGATVRFVTYAAEELTGYTQWSGSMYHAEKLHAVQEDLRLHICNDMVAWSPGPGFKLGAAIMPSGPFEWAGRLTIQSANVYSQLNLVPLPGPVSDSEWFRHLGYSFAGFMEHSLTPNYHTPHDSVVHCNLPLCLEAAKANCAILMNELLTPVPRQPVGISMKEAIRITWTGSSTASVAQNHIYRSINPDSLFVWMGSCAGNIHDYIDSTAEAGKKYYYRIASSDAEGHQSTCSDAAFGAVAPRSRQVLVVKDTKGGVNNPEDSAVMDFYRHIFKNCQVDLSDASVADSLDISVLGQYRQIFWLSNSYSDNPNSSIHRRRSDLAAWVRDGGQLFLAGFLPGWMLNSFTKFEATFVPGDTLFDLYKTAGIERKPQACCNGAFPIKPEYPQLYVDPEKCPVQLAGHLMNLESLKPAPAATTVYTWMTAFDSLTNQGRMKGKPVGIEYLGDDCKLVLMSVPLYYLDTAAARELVEMVSKEKFTLHTGLAEKGAGCTDGIDRIWPNPASDLVTIVFHPDDRSEISFMLLDLSGRLVMTVPSARYSAGRQQIQIKTDLLKPGIYVLLMYSQHSLHQEKVLISP